MAPPPQAPRRVQLVIGVFGLVSLGLLIQLIRVQFGPYAPVFAALDRGGRGLTEEVRPARGLIFDRDGVLLAGNATRYYLEVGLRQLDGNQENAPGAVSAPPR